MTYDTKRTPGYPHEQGFGYYYQGDVLLRKPKGGRLAYVDPTSNDLWTNGVVPYVVKANFTGAERRLLQAAFTQYATKTCVRFVRRTNELQYITITNDPTGCYSYVGRSPDPTENVVNLQTPGCMTDVGTPVHELMHTLGFLHEQSRSDRDTYITFHPENLRSEYQDPQFIAINFGKYEDPSLTNYGVSYGLDSVMHYSRLAGAVSANAPVLTPNKPFFGDFGNPAGLSAGDAKQVNARYCDRVKSYDPKKTPGYPHEQGLGHYYQADILLRRTTKEGRFAVASPYKIDYWPKGVVPYVVRANFTAAESQLLQAAFEQYATKTCVRFVPRTSELQYVTITNDHAGCYSYVGRSPDPTENVINLQTPACMTDVGTPVHELMHTLGFLHEQSRPDRDEYIDFHPENLALQYQDPQFIAVNFDVYDSPYTTTYNVPYNYISVMHYSRLGGAASWNAPVLTAKKTFFGDFGNPAGLSAGDVKQLMIRYCTA
uniref:Metalloendopeptidase n=1 Tax=Anopheles dirus TaxID=7168 RepID=A0A182NB32_9DIPT